MASRDPVELRTRLRNASFDGDPEVLPILREEAQRTVEQQVSTLNDIDTKASRILRINIVLLGLLVTGLSYISQAEGVAVAGFDNRYFVAGMGSVVLSSALAGLTYSASEIDGGVGADNIAATLDSGVDSEQFSEFLLKNYAMRINFNRSTNVRNAPLVTTTVLSLVAGLGLVGLGTFHAFYGPVPDSWSVAFAVGLGLYAWFTGLFDQSRNAVDDVRNRR